MQSVAWWFKPGQPDIVYVCVRVCVCVMKQKFPLTKQSKTVYASQAPTLMTVYVGRSIFIIYFLTLQERS